VGKYINKEKTGTKRGKQGGEVQRIGSPHEGSDHNRTKKAKQQKQFYQTMKKKENHTDRKKKKVV